MPIKIVFLGRLETAAGASEREVACAATLDDVLNALEAELAATLRADAVKLAVNGVLVSDRGKLVLNDGDELAFLPPVSGG